MNMIMKKPFEFVSTLTLILWGAWVSWPTFSTFNVGGVYRQMAKTAPEWIWGAFVLSIGIIKAFLMYSKYTKLRVIMALIVMAIFAIIAAFFALGNWMSVGVPMYISFVIISWFSYMEVLSENGLSLKKDRIKE